MQKLGNLESVVVSKSEFDVCENFEEDISFTKTVMRKSCHSNQNAWNVRR